MNAIFARSSIRKYTEQKVSDDQVQELLKAAMSAPSAGNQQPWEFIVLRDRAVMQKITEFHPYSGMLKTADVAIVVCGDENKEKHQGFWVQDCSAATENILLEAQVLGLGAVWVGVFPLEDRIKGIKQVLQLPQSVIPLSIVSIGYPAEHKEPVNRYNESRVHYNHW